jgi:hypothetical protein
VNRWKIAFFMLLVCTLIGAGASVYALVDAGVTQTYREADYASTITDLEVLRDLVPAVQRPLTRADALVLLRRQQPTALIATTDSTLAIGQLTFLFAPTGTLRNVLHPSARSARP